MITVFIISIVPLILFFSFCHNKDSIEWNAVIVVNTIMAILLVVSISGLYYSFNQVVSDDIISLYEDEIFSINSSTVYGVCDNEIIEYQVDKIIVDDTEHPYIIKRTCSSKIDNPMWLFPITNTEIILVLSNQ